MPRHWVPVGSSAQATAQSTTALGQSADATMVGATAVGSSAQATARFTTALGQSAEATMVDATAVGSSAPVGSSAQATAQSTTALGRFADATMVGATAVGYDANATLLDSTALGASSSAAGFATTALGHSSSARGPLSTAIGQDSDIDINSTHAIALGEDAKIINAPGGIAIGSDFNGIDTGATVTAMHAIALGANSAATQPGAIAIGADVVADKANTMTVGTAVEFVRNDGTSNLLIEENNATVAVRTLGELANNGGVRLRFNNKALGEEWDFTSNQTGGFQFSLVGSGGAELSVGTNGTIRMGPGPISNLTLFPSGNVTIEGVLTENSDVNSKQDINPLDPQAILDKVMELPISEWSYQDDAEVRHIGPMAQDFYQAFELGHTDKGISTLDSSGIALAAIQAVKQEKDQQIKDLKHKNNELIQRLERLEALLSVDGYKN